jgi:hypothetical protein
LRDTAMVDAPIGRAAGLDAAMIDAAVALLRFSLTLCRFVILMLLLCGLLMLLRGLLMLLLRGLLMLLVCGLRLLMLLPLLRFALLLTLLLVLCKGRGSGPEKQ